MRFYSDYYYNLQVFQHYLTATMKDSKKSLIKSLNIFKSSPKNDNSLSTGKFMNNEITPFDVSQPCWAHPNQFLSHFCQNCEFKPLCGLCLHEGNHKNHIIRSIDKACKIVHRILTEILITIRAKSNLMQILEQHIQSRKKQLSNELDQYLQNINENFDHIQSCLQQKRHKIVQTIKKYYEVEENKIKQAERNAKQENEKLKTMIEILSEKAEKLQATSLCVYFYQKKQILQSNLEQGNKTYQQLKKMVPDLKWIIKSQVFEKLKNQINFLSIQIQKNQIQLLSGSPKKGNEQQKTKQKLIMNEKSLRGLKLEKKIRNQTKTSGFWTPKHVDSNKISQKILKQLREERQLQKLISSESIQKLNKIDTTGIIKKGKAKKYPKDL